MTDQLLFLRFTTKKKNKGFIPEILLILTASLSAFFWNRSISTVSGTILFVLWLTILILLFSLALTNLKTMLLPTKLVYTLGVVIIGFLVISAIQQGSASGLWEGVLGGLILGGIPWIIYILSSGSWIGFGDVRLGFVAGLLLGWKYSLLCVALMFILLMLAFVFFYTASKFTKNPSSQKMETGMLWTVSIIVCFLFGHYLIK